MSKEEIYEIPNTTYNCPIYSVDSTRESILDENDYLELQRLRTLSSGRFGDEDSDYNEEMLYYNFIAFRNAHSAPHI